MSDQPEPVKLGDLGYYEDPGHTMYLELVNAGGQVMQSFHLPAPLNNDARAPFAVQITVAHEDGCARTLQVVPIKPY